jgi:enoyl-CoA hydratase
MRTTISPGSVDTDQHAFAIDAEVGPQAQSIESPEFAERLAAARRR